MLVPAMRACTCAGGQRRLNSASASRCRPRAAGQDRGDQVDQQADARLPPPGARWARPSPSPPLGGAVGRSSHAAVELAGPDEDPGERRLRGCDRPARPSRAASAMASSHCRRARAKEWWWRRTRGGRRQATSRYGRPMSRARAAPSCRCRSLSASRSDHASVTPRFSSAMACRSLLRATSALDWPAAGEEVRHLLEHAVEVPA